MPCPYANVLGVPNEGFHALRIGGFAFNDIAGTLAISALTSYATKISFLRATAGWFAVAELLHYAFGVRTAFLERLNLAPKCESPTTNNGDSVAQPTGTGAE
jgi:hypothetical protein